MKKIYRICLSLSLLLILASCTAQSAEEPSPTLPDISTDLLEQSAYLDIQGGMDWVGAYLTVDDPELLAELTDMIFSRTYTPGEKVGNNVDSCGTYRMAWYGDKYTPLAEVVLSESAVLFSDQCISTTQDHFVYDSDTYYIPTEKIDFTRLENLFAEAWPFQRSQADWAILRDEATGQEVPFWGRPLMEVREEFNCPLDKIDPAAPTGYTCEWYDAEGKQTAKIEHITRESFCWNGSTYTPQYEEGINFGYMTNILLAARGEEEGIINMDIKAVNISNGQREVYIEDRAAIKEIIAMFAGAEITDKSGLIADTDYCIDWIEGFTEWTLGTINVTKDGVFTDSYPMTQFKTASFDPARLDELIESAAIEKLLPEAFSRDERVAAVRLTGLGKTVEIPQQGSGWSELNFYISQSVKKIGPAEEIPSPILFTVAWLDADGGTIKEISECEDGTVLMDGTAYTVVYGNSVASYCINMLETDGRGGIAASSGPSA